MASHTSYSVPYNLPHFGPKSQEYLQQAVASGKLSGNGQFSDQCCRHLEAQTRCRKAFLTPSCTAALEMSALLIDLQPGDEVIVPSFTFVSTANAYALVGAKPVFVDIDRDTLNLNPACLASALTPKTKAIVAVHYAGVACDMDPIIEFARTHGLFVIEDNAHGLTGHYRDRPLGSLGDLATLSFHETKNFTCGEGGALLVNRADLINRAHIIQEKGTNRSRFLLGLVDKYTWVDRGSSYLLGELPAAFLLASLEHQEWSQARRLILWNRYHETLAPWAAKNGVRQPILPAYSRHPAHIYYLLMPNLEARQKLMQELAKLGILAVFHYQSLHLSPMGVKFGGRPGQCPVTEDVADRLVRLPLFADLTDEQQAQVLEAIIQLQY